MAVQTGSATNYHDALDKLRIFCSSVLGWTVLRWNAPATLLDQGELAVRPIGTGDFRPVVTVRSFNDAPNGFYHWRISAAMDFDTLQLQLSQPGSSPGSYVPLSNGAMTYWFYGNDRRVICVFKSGTNYSFVYLGLFLPYAFPNEYRRPLYVGGVGNAQRAWNESNTRNSFFADPGFEGSFFMDRADLWVNVQNRDTTTVSDPSNVTNTTSACIWPKKSSLNSGNSGASSSAYAWTYQQLIQLRPNALGEVPLFPLQILSRPENSGNGALMGALDGCYDVPAFNKVAEQTLTYGGNTFRIFPNVYRTIASQFLAIEEI